MTKISADLRDALRDLLALRTSQWRGRVETVQGPEYAGWIEQKGAPKRADALRDAVGDIGRNADLLMSEAAELLDAAEVLPAEPEPEPEPEPSPDVEVGTETWPYGSTPGQWLYVGDGPNVRQDSRSGEFVDDLVSALRSGYAILTSTGETPPVYIARAGDPTYTVRISGHAMDGERLHAPPGISQGGGSDHPLIVLDPTSQTEYRFWQATVSGSTITARSGGMFDYGPDGDGRPFKGNGVGCGLSYLNGMIRRAEFDRYLDGHVPASEAIPHALRFSSGFIGGGVRFPATKSDQSGNDAPMGTRYYLDITADECDRRTAPDDGVNTMMCRAICHALRKHGMYASDGSGAAINLYLEGEATGRWGDILTGNQNRIIRGNGFMGGGSRSTDGVPWDRMVVRADEGLSY